MPVPAKDILNESIGNLYFQGPMGISMMSVLTFSCVTSILYLLRRVGLLELPGRKRGRQPEGLKKKETSRS